MWKLLSIMVFSLLLKYKLLSLHYKCVDKFTVGNALKMIIKLALLVTQLLHKLIKIIFC